MARADAAGRDDRRGRAHDAEQAEGVAPRAEDEAPAETPAAPAPRRRARRPPPPPPPPPSLKLDPRDLLDRLLPPNITDKLPSGLQSKNGSRSSGESERNLLDYLLGP